jgi:hypothetical protein
MASIESGKLPNVAEILGQVLQRVSAPEQPLLIAIAERLAAERYRLWAAGVADPARSAQLVACAGREEEIARRIEALFPNASAVQTDIRAKNPDLEELNRSLFANRPLHEQFAIQAQGERLGAATWRGFAARGER